MININGIDWKIYLVSSNHPQLKNLNRVYLGCCDKETKSIYINENLNDIYLKKVLCHELVHACMFSYQVQLDDFQEEILADLIATYGEEIIDITNSTFKRLRKMKIKGILL